MAEYKFSKIGSTIHSWALNIARSQLNYFWRIFLALLTAVFIFVSLPNADQGWIAWIALFPLILACRNLNAYESLALGMICGLFSTLLIFSWVFNVVSFNCYHALILANYLSFYPAAWCCFLVSLGRRKYLLLIVAPALWISLDFLKAHAGFLAFPWASLAFSQRDNLPLLQILTVTGEYGVSFLIVMANISIYQFIFHHDWRIAIAVLLLIVFLWSWGAKELAQPTGNNNIQVAIVQPNILLAERETISGYLESLKKLEKLTYEAANQQPNFIVWPETAIRNFPHDPIAADRIRRLVKSIQIPLFFGASEYEKFSNQKTSGNESNELFVPAYNSAYLLMGDGTISSHYRKRILVPFAEYIPLKTYFNWPKWIVDRDIFMQPGTETGYGFPDNKIKIGLIICWENLFSEYIRGLVKGGAQAIVQFTNDVHFGNSAAPRQHIIASKFRAIENRIFLIVSSNTGPSAIFDKFGRSIAEVGTLFSTGIAVAKISTETENTVYSSIGDLFAYACIILSLYWITILVKPDK